MPQSLIVNSNNLVIQCTIRVQLCCVYTGDDDHVDGLRPHPQTAAINSPTVHPPGDICA
jgi:hypothetical protein